MFSENYICYFSLLVVIFFNIVKGNSTEIQVCDPILPCIINKKVDSNKTEYLEIYPNCTASILEDDIRISCKSSTELEAIGVLLQNNTQIIFEM